MPALFLLILWAVAELLVAIKVAELVGVLLTVLLLLASWPVGLWLMKAEGRAAWRRLTITVAQGRRPGQEVVDGGLIVLGGILLIVPGFITDVLGLGLLLAPVRALAGRSITRHVQSRAVQSAARFSRTPGSGYDVDSTATDVDPPPLPR